MALRTDWNGPLTMLALLIVVATALRLLMAWVVPPLTDVYYYNTQAIEVFFGGSDPYGHLFTGIPASLVTPGAERIYAYLPGVFLFLAPFRALGDIRLGLMAADVAVALTLYSLKGRWSLAAAAAFLFAPWGFFFATTSPNSSLPAMVFLGLAFLWEARGRTLLSAASLGFSLASSQFVWLLCPFFLLHYARRRDLRSTWVSVLVAALIVLPFVVWDSGSFFYDTVVFQFTRAPPSLVTQVPLGFDINPTLSGIANALLGVSVPLSLKAGILLVALLLLLRRPGGLQNVALNACVFLTVATLVLPANFSTCYLELPFQMGLTWAVLAWRGPGPELGPSLPSPKEQRAEKAQPS